MKRFSPNQKHASFTEQASRNQSEKAHQAVEDSLCEIFDKFTWVVLNELKEMPAESEFFISDADTQLPQRKIS